MKDRRKQLKVKIKSLAEEARIIRLEERRAKERGDYRLFCELQDHRRRVVREAARESQLAYFYVRGCPMGKEPEAKCRKPLPHNLEMVIARFGPVQQDGESREDWSRRGGAWLEDIVKDLDMVDEDIRLRIMEYNHSAPERAERRRIRWIRCEANHAQRRTLPDSERVGQAIANIRKELAAQQ
jgi:hypothetical protein